MLEPNVKNALNQIDFLHRYLALCNKYKVKGHGGPYNIDGEVICDSICDLADVHGVDIDENVVIFEPVILKGHCGSFEFKFCFCYWDHTIDSHWDIYHDGEIILDSEDIPVEGFLQVLSLKNLHGMPRYRSYEDIRAIVSDLLEIYQDFQTALINN